MNNMYKNKLFLIVSTMLATAFVTQSCSENEPEYVKVTGITVTPENTVLLINDTVTLVTRIFPRLATDKSVIWNSDNTSVATVDNSNGLVTALSEGLANISVTSVANSEKTKTCIVTVVKTFSVSLNASSLRLPLAATHAMKATIVPNNISQEVRWTSDNPDVATIAADGLITAVAAGTATITAISTIDENRTAECQVTVNDISSTNQTLVGVWTFEDAAALGKATKGEDLEVNGVFTSVDGPNGTKAVVADENAYFIITHNIGVNGGGSKYTNEYTLMMDIRGSQEGFNEWLSVFESSEGGLLWIDSNGAIGYDALGGYSETTLTPDTWHRVVVAVKLGESFKVYIDGALVFTATQTIDLDGAMSLYTDKVYIGYDAWGYAGPDFAEVRMWSVQLTDEEVATLGSPSTMLGA
jgi:uncharacterized protein YjdB